MRQVSVKQFNVFSSRLNLLKHMSHCQGSTSRLFHIRGPGPATAKLLSPSHDCVWTSVTHGSIWTKFNRQKAAAAVIDHIIVVVYNLHIDNMGVALHRVVFKILCYQCVGCMQDTGWPKKTAHFFGIPYFCSH